MPIPKLTPAQADAAYTSAQKVVETHRRIAAWLRPGVTLPQIDTFVAKTLDALECKSCFKGYKISGLPPFPSHACLSVNSCVVHGTAASYLHPLKYGDLVKIDIGVTHRGWVGDAGWTYCFGEPSPLVKKLMDCGQESLRLGILQIKPGNRWLEFAKAVQGHVENKCRFHNVQNLGGHGYGRSLHESPFVSNSMPGFLETGSDAYLPCLPGTLVAVEPMVGAGTGVTVQKSGQWPVHTADGSLSVHYEHDVLVTESGHRILSEGMDDLTNIII